LIQIKDALSKAKQQHEMRYQNQSFVTNQEHSKRFYEKNQSNKHEMSKAIFIETTDQFSQGE
jgi:hypothetical protein